MKDVAEVLPVESLDLETLTARQVAALCPEAAGEIKVHEHGGNQTAEHGGTPDGGMNSRPLSRQGTEPARKFNA
jgi:hypothetical protein